MAMCERLREMMTPGTTALVVGLAALWPCLQSSGFYPLSLVASIAARDQTSVAWLHLAYSAELVALFLAAMPATRRVQAFLTSPHPVACLVAGTLGVVSQAMLCAADATDASFIAVAACCSPLVALFVAFFVLLWGCRLSCGRFERAALVVVLSYLASQVVSALLYLTGLPYSLLPPACAGLSAICAALWKPSAPADVTGHPASFGGGLRSLPWGVIAPVLALIYFCVMFVRLRSASFSGDASQVSKCFTAAIATVVFAVALLAFLRAPSVGHALVISLALFVVVCLAGMAMAMFLPVDGLTLANRGLVAGEHCLEVFVWLAFVRAVVDGRVPPVPAFGLYGILVVALAWVLSFDVCYLLGLDGAASDASVAKAVLTVALLVVSAGTIALLVGYMFRTLREEGRRAQDVRDAWVRDALRQAGLTDQELEVAVLTYRGHAARKIAETLDVSEPTVKSYRSKVYRKLAVGSKQELIDYVDARGPAS